MSSVSNNWGMDTMSENWGMDGVGNNWGMDSMGNNWGMDGMSNWGSSSIVWLSLVGDISNETIIVVGMILNMLDSAVRKVDRVFSINNTGSIIVLSLVESSTRVVISDSIGVRVWGRLSKVISNISSMGNWGVVSWGSVDNWGMIGWGSMDSMVHWGMDSMVNWGMDSVGNNWGSVVEEWGSMNSMGNWGMDSVVNWGMDSVDSMGDNGISSVKSVGGISNNSGVGAESLALGGGSVFSLVWLADRLMADLSVSISIDWSVGTIVHWGNGSRDWGGQNWGMDSGMVSNSVVHQTEVGAGGGHNSAQTQESLHVCVYVLSR